jgi:P27 family predicted phage terminase small subunit
MTEAAVPRPAAVPRAPATPRHLQAAGRDLWRRVAGAYALEPHHEAILQAAAEAADRIAEARAAIEADGAYVEGRFGKKAHPGLSVERDSRIAMLRAIRELGLDLIEASRPPTRWRP